MQRFGRWKRKRDSVNAKGWKYHGGVLTKINAPPIIQKDSLKVKVLENQIIFYDIEIHHNADCIIDRNICLQQEGKRRP